MKIGLNQWIIRVRITPQLLIIHLSLHEKSSRLSEGDAEIDLDCVTPNLDQ